MTDPVREDEPGGSFFSKRYAGIPAWGWVAGAALVAGVWFFVQRRKAPADTAPTQQTVATDDTRYGDVQSQLAAVNAQIRDLQSGQTQSPPASGGDYGNGNPVIKLPNPNLTDERHTTDPLPPNTSLTQLALYFWGDGSLSPWLYWVNQEKIEAAAKKAGYPNSGGGTFLAPGLVLWVPPKPVVEHTFTGAPVITGKA